MPTVASTLSAAPATSSWRLSAARIFSAARAASPFGASLGSRIPKRSPSTRATSVGGADRALQPGGHLHEDGVALGAAERVVHVAEAVEVDDEEGRLLVVAASARGGRLEEQRAVRQAGERVVEGEVLHLRRPASRRDARPPSGARAAGRGRASARDDRHRRAEREQRGGGPAAEDEVGAQVVGDRAVLEQRLGGAGERGVGGEEDDGRDAMAGRSAAWKSSPSSRPVPPRPRARARRAPTRSRAGRG